MFLYTLHKNPDYPNQSAVPEKENMFPAAPTAHSALEEQKELSF